MNLIAWIFKQDVHKISVYNITCLGMCLGMNQVTFSSDLDSGPGLVCIFFNQLKSLCMDLDEICSLGINQGLSD